MFCVFAIFVFVKFASATDVPIIGILSQEIYDTNKTQSYIAASYVKFVESAGARVVPIWIGQNHSYYAKIVNYTNGLLFPGGGVYFNETGGYGEAASILYDLSVAANDRGVYYPLWGTCLGIEAIIYSIAKKYVTVGCSVKNIALPLQFLPGVATSKMFPRSSEITYILQTENVAYNNHVQCVTEETLKEGNVTNWKVLATTDAPGTNITFVSAMESTDYPFYGIQFHAEKNVFEFIENKGIPHTEDAVKVAQYFANFIVNESRKNNNTFPCKDLEVKSLIYNYSPTYTGILNSSFEQKYIFSQAVVDSSPLVKFRTDEIC